MYRIPLSESLFGKEPQVVLQSDEFTVTAFAYPQNIAALKIANSRGFVEVLPLMGQIIWDAVFDGKSLRMDNMFQNRSAAAKSSIPTAASPSIPGC